MAATSKKLSIYILAGIFMATIIIAAVFSSGVQLPSMNPGGNTQPNPSANPTANPTSQTNMGTLMLYIKDAPVEPTSLNVEFDSVEVLGPDGWTTLAFTEGTETVSFNLLELQDVTADLSVAELPVGTYNKIRLSVLSATATFTDDPEEVPTTLKVPSEKIDILVKFEIQEGAITQVVIDMTQDPNAVAISNSHNLRPVVKATVIPATASTATESPEEPTPTPTPTSTEEPSPTPTSTEEQTPSPPPTEEPTPTPTETATAIPQAQTNTGNLIVYIKDAPVELSELEVTIDSVEVQGKGGWTTLPITGEPPTATFDLLQLQDVVATLSIAEIPAGNYNKIRLHVLSATATFTDSSTAELNVPSEKIDVIVKFEVEEGQTTQVIIDMTADTVAISNSSNLRPVVKATVIPATTLAPPPESPEETPTPTPTPTSTEEPTPTPSSTPASTEEPTPTPTSTEEPTPTPTPTSTEEPTPTPTPTEEPPTPTLTPTQTEEPTPTPTPTATPTT